MSALNSAREDGWVRLTADGLDLFMHSNRGIEGRYGIYLTRRGSAADPFPAPSLHVAAPEDVWDPAPTPDGLTLYYSGKPTPGIGDELWHILVARRLDRESPFGTPALVEGVATYGFTDAGPAVTGDERVMVWHTARPGGEGNLDLWYAVRPDPSVPFGTPRPLAELNTASDDWKPFLRADGCELWFTSDVGGAGWEPDVVRARILGP